MKTLIKTIVITGLMFGFAQAASDTAVQLQNRLQIKDQEKLLDQKKIQQQNQIQQKKESMNQYKKGNGKIIIPGSGNGGGGGKGR